MSSFSTGLYGSTISGIVSNVNDAFSGKTSGINVSSIVSELMQVEDQPEVQLQSQQTTVHSQITALTGISTQLTALYSSENSLKDILGAFSQNTTGSSDAAIVSASAGSSATAGTHSVTVSKLATISSSYSGYISSGTSLGGQQIVVGYGPDSSNPLSSDTINIPSTDTTLQQVASYINAGKYGVTASAVTDAQGSRLVLVSKASGAVGNLTVTSPATSFNNSGGVDAQLSVDGVPVDSASNTVTGAIPGVTLSLGAADPNTPVLISVQPDTSQASQAIQTFVDAYNAVIGSINSQYTLNSSGQEGVLAGDSMLRFLQSSLLSLVTTSVSGAGQYVNLQSMGIEMQNDGTLQVNSTNLSKALSSNFSDVQTFFQSPKGWGVSAGTQLLQLTDPTLGPVAADINGLNQTNRSLTDQINDFEVRMATVKDQLTTQYDNLNTLLQEYPMQLQEIAGQLSSLPNATSSSKS
jgi:flagellar hook-associated protein 2